MSIDEIKELIRLVQETGVAELEVKRGENSVRVRSSLAVGHESIVPTVVPVPIAATQAALLPQHSVHVPAQAPAPHAPQPSAPAEDERNVTIKSPIVGTYYDAPSPGAAPFVRVGDRVEPKQILCIIESMKLMNEIEAEIAGTVVAKLVENGRPVEYGESLFSIRPA